MRLLRACAFGVLAAGAVACSKDLDGELVTPEPLAGLRYVHVVPDTGAMDFRVIDIIGNAPNQIQAVFRTGGTANGAPQVAGTLPLHQGVAAGTRHIRVFRSDSSAATASIVIFDTTVTLTANINYTFFLYGYSRTGQTPAMNATLVVDDAADPGATNTSFRIVHLAPTLAPTLATAAVDVFVDTLGAAVQPTGTPQFANVVFGDVRTYVTRPARVAAGAVPALNYRTAVAATGTTTPFFQTDAPNGTIGSSTVNPIPGDLVAGTAITALIVPPSVAGSQAPTFATPSVVYLIDRLPPRTAP